MSSIPRTVLAAFGVEGHPATALDGGQGSSLHVGHLVLKPHADADEVGWFATLAADIEPVGFRLPRPVAALDGRWVVDGWSAVEHVPGEAEPDGRWPELLAVARRFHDAVAAVERPGFLDTREHRWAMADRVAWGEEPSAAVAPVATLLARLEALREPVDLPAQLVHGDLSGNVLFADGLDPAVIDVSPYWRPARYADAIVVVDAVTWWGADRVLLEHVADCPQWPQLLVRAVVFRLASLNDQVREAVPGALEQFAGFGPTVDAVEALVRR